MHHNEKSSHLVALLSLSVILALAGCGGGGGGSGDSPTVTAATVPADAASAADADSGPPALDFMVANKQITAAPAGLADGATSATAPVADVSLPSTPEPALATVNGDPAEMATALSVRTATPEATAAVTNPSLDIFVATNGNDTWSGLLLTANTGLTDGPVRTITAAQVIARQRLAAMAAGATRQQINVRIGAGEYRLTAPLTFGPTDSGVLGAAVVYRAETAGTVTLSGAMTVGNATGPAAGTVVSLPAPALGANVMRGGTQLFVNGKRATLARSPNEGNYWFVQKVVPLADEPVGKVGQEAFEPPPAALTLINGLSSADRSQAMLKIMQAWSSGRHRVSSLTAPAGAVRVTPRTLWPFLNVGTNQRFYVENVAAALDAPGEWLWDATGLRYIATAADVGKPLKFEMPVLDQLLIIKGDAATASWVHDLEFHGLGFSGTRLLTPDAGFTDNQAGVTIGAAIEVDAARRVLIDGCTIQRTGGYGIWMRAAVRESTVNNCKMSDLGAGGVKVGLTAQLPTDLNGTGLNKVQNNAISDNGKVIPGAVGVWIGQSSDNTVANNLISNTSYTAISVGWSWKYGSATAMRNRITANLMLNIGQGQLSDLAGIYTLGESTGTVISGNIIQEVRPYPGYGAGAWGLYNDEASTGITWERNIVIGTDAGGYLLHYGRNLIVRNNLLAYGDRGEVQVTRSDPLTNLNFNNNLLIPKNSSPFVSFATAPDVLFNANKVSSVALSAAAITTKCGSGCAAVNVTLSVGADPRIITLTGADATTNTWVAEVGAAVGPPGLTYATVPPVITTPPPVVVAPPVAYTAQLADTAIGGKPINLRYVTGGNAASITVQADVGTPSGKSLRFLDSAAIIKRWEPYAWAVLNHTKVSSTAEFSIRIDAASNLLHEWRDDANVFLTGPALRVKPTGIEVAGKVVAPAPLGQWIILKIIAPLDTAAGTWTLEVRYANGNVVTVNNLANKNVGWKRLNWLGFVSDSALTSTASIGYITVKNDAP